MSSGDPADCALVCERDRRCRAWSFNYPTDMTSGSVCWLKNSVPARVQDNCCVSGVRGAGVLEPRNSTVETSIDRFGGDYKNFDVKRGEGDEACKAACAADNKCRAWTYARPGYAGKEAHCFLKKEIKPPRRKAGLRPAWCGRRRAPRQWCAANHPFLLKAVDDFLRSAGRRPCGIRRQHRDLRP